MPGLAEFVVLVSLMSTICYCFSTRENRSQGSPECALYAIPLFSCVDFDFLLGIEEFAVSLEVLSILKC